MSQIIPDRPAGLSGEEWNFILDRDHRECAMVNECRMKGLVGPDGYCSPRLDMDHQQQKALGGDDGFVNRRLLCLKPNRGRGILDPSPKWTRRSFWDGRIVAGRLRVVQSIAGYGAVMVPGLGRLLTERRNDILPCITLLPGATGIGKSVQAQSVFFGINEVVNEYGSNRPRVGQVLWLTPDTTLRDMGVKELRDDAFNIGVVTHGRPTVTAFDGFDDFRKGPGDYDIVVSCPHCLWKMRGANTDEDRRTDDEIRAVLAWYDTIVFDECDWATDRVRYIATLASHALKFSLTASPPIIEGNDTIVAERFLKSFVLISEDAVADYNTALNIDGCLKVVDRDVPFTRTSGHDSHDALVRGTRRSVDGKADLGHAVFLAAIKQAAREMDALETAMRNADPENYFSPHIIVRFGFKEDIIALNEALGPALESMRLKNPGWRPTPLFEDHATKLKGTISKEEADLSKQDKNGNWVHPFMRGKNAYARGRADESSKRICLIANIGIRGINNWPITAVVDCSGKIGVGQITQLTPGRALRLPHHLSHYLKDAELRRFVTARLYLPESSADDSDKETSIRDSREFIFNMKERIASKGFRTWQQILDGVGPDDVPAPKNSCSQTPFSEVDKIRIMNEMGMAKANNLDLYDPNEITRIVSTLKPEATDSRRERAELYATNIRDNAAFRNQEVLGTRTEEHFKRHPIPVITKLKPQDKYDIDTLSRFVRECSDFESDRSVYLLDLEAGHEGTIKLISMRLRETQERDYQEPPGQIFRLQGNGKDGQQRGVLNDIAGALSDGLVNGGAMHASDIGKVFIAVNLAAQTVFGVESAAEGGPMDHHAYHVEIITRASRPIKDIARGTLVKWGILKSLSVLVS